MRDRAGVVIIGAGIVGCGVAEHLTRMGWRDLVVLDQGPLFEAGGSTSHAPGLVFQTNPSKTMTEFAKYTVRRYSELGLDGQPCFYPVGSVEVATTPERWKDLKRKQGLATSWGIYSELISPEECVAKVPLIDPGKIYGGFFVPSDGIAKAVRACEAMARMATDRGAAFQGETEVTGIEVEGGRVRAVETSRGRIETDLVISCAGMWGPKIGRMVGMRVPLTPCSTSSCGPRRSRSWRGRPGRRPTPWCGTRTARCTSGTEGTTTASAPTNTARCPSRRMRSRVGERPR